MTCNRCSFVIAEQRRARHLTLVFQLTIMEVNVQVEVGKCDYLKCNIFIANQSKNTLKIKYLKAQLFNFAKSRRSNAFAHLDFAKKISDKEVIWSVNETKILVSDLEMPSKSYGVVFMEASLPMNWMPTFRGKSLHMSTKLRLELVTDNMIKKYLIPIKIEPLKIATKEPFETHSDNALQKSNPFLKEPNQGNKILALQGLSTPFYGRISDVNGEIAKVVLHKRHFQVGDPIIGIMDFRGISKSSRICAYFVVSLMAIEYWKNENSSIFTAHESRHETCLGTDFVSFTLDVPKSSTPTFSTHFCKSSLSLIPKPL